MFKELKELTGSSPVSCDTESYDIIRFHHPDGGGRCEVIKTGLTLAKAQQHCNDPSTSSKIGASSSWWFDGYAETESKTSHMKIW